MKIDDASLMTDTAVQNSPDTQLPTGYIGDLATSITQLKNYMLNQIGFAPLFDSSSKGQAIILNSRDLDNIESTNTNSGLFYALASCSNNPIVEDGLLLWLRGSVNEQTQIWHGISAGVYIRRKTGGTWGSWSLLFGSASTYTPTISNTTNVASSISSVACWSRVGNVVTVSGSCIITATVAAPTSTTFSINLPIASTLISGACRGPVTLISAAWCGGIVQATSAKAQILYQASTTNPTTVAYEFQYLIE